MKYFQARFQTTKPTVEILLNCWVYLNISWKRVRLLFVWILNVKNDFKFTFALWGVCFNFKFVIALVRCRRVVCIYSSDRAAYTSKTLKLATRKIYSNETFRGSIGTRYSYFCCKLGDFSEVFLSCGAIFNFVFFFTTNR